jgi:amino acid adenylation domain-containing protein/FkbM family methyltransferase
VVIGTPVAGRTLPETEGLIGFFVNTLALRVGAGAGETFTGLLGRVREVCLGAYAHQEAPFERVVEELGVARDLSRHPVFQVAIALQNAPAEELRLPGLDLIPFEFEAETAKFDLTLFLTKDGDELKGDLEYNADLFEAETAGQMARHFMRLLEAVVVEPGLRVWELPLLTGQERELIVEGWNRTAHDFGTRASLPEMLAEQAARTPDGVALSFEGERLTYAELNRRADRLARLLRRRGIRPEAVVGVLMERSVEMVVALLAVLKAGGAYLPLDPEYPRERLAFMLEDSGARLVLAQRHLHEALHAHGVEVINLDQDGLPDCAEPPSDEGGSENSEEVAGRVLPDGLAYVIYTSGSTGTPKAVMSTHAGLSNRLLWMQDAYRLSPQDRVLQKTPFSFDVSVWEFFWPLMTGARLVVARAGGHRDPAYLRDLIAAEGITTLHFVPSMLEAFLDTPGLEVACGTLTRVVCSGEALPPAARDRFFEKLGRATLHNLYGPTEASIDVTAWECRPGERAVPIGRPIANTRVHLLAGRMEPVPVGVTGELHIGGVALARGYFGRPDLTAELFVPDPLSRTPGARLYRTGDLARYLPTGEIEYVGRADGMVKVRGRRVELGEVEAALRRHPAVGEAAAAALGAGAGRGLYGYVVPDADSAGVARRLLRLRREGALEGVALYELANGMVLAHRNRGETEFMYEEIFTRRSYERYGVRLPEGGCVFDVGANVGLFMLRVWERCPAARVYAFEPVPEIFELLRLNAALYGGRGELVRAALGESEGRAEFTYYPHVSLLSGQYADAGQEREVVKAYVRGQREAGGLAEGALEELLAERLEGRHVWCEVRTVSAVMAELGVARVDLLKVDAEKGEAGVLAGVAEEDWGKIGQVVVEVHDLSGRLDELKGMLEGRGYRVSVEQEEGLEGTGLYNLYAVREGWFEGGAGEECDPPRAKQWFSPEALVRDVQDFVEKELPEYMVPSAIMALDELPVTANGKLARRALPTPKQTRQRAGRAFVAPRDSVELELAGIWEEVLGFGPVGVRDGFFELGGHSLMALRLLARIQQTTGRSFPVAIIYQRGTVEQFAHMLREQTGEHFNATVVGIQPRGDQRPFFCVHPAGGEVICYASLAHRLGPEQPFFGLRARGINDGEPSASVEEMAAHYIEEMRQVQPEGPYRFGGWSLGGVVAYEMARQLVARGEEVALLVLIDSSIPTRGERLWLADEQLLMRRFVDDVFGPSAASALAGAELISPGTAEQLSYVFRNAQAADLLPPDANVRQIHRLYDVFKANTRALLDYRPRPCPASAVLFVAAERGEQAEQTRHGWEELTEGGLEFHTIPGNHYTVLAEPNVAAVAEQLKTRLAESNPAL